MARSALLRQSSPCRAARDGRRRIAVWRARPAAGNAPAWRDRRSTAASRSANGSSRTSCRGRPCARRRAHGSRCTSVARAVERLRRVALRAADDAVQPEQRVRASDRDRRRCPTRQVFWPWQASQPPFTLPPCGSSLRWQPAQSLASFCWRPAAVWQTWQSSLACAPCSANLCLRGVIVIHRAASARCRGSRRTWRRSARRAHRRRGGSRRSPSGSCPCNCRCGGRRCSRSWRARRAARSRFP